MSGLFSAPEAPVAPVSDNSATIALMEAQMRQNELLFAQQSTANADTAAADMAQAEQLRAIEVRDAEAEAEKLERERRVEKGKSDLLYLSSLGVEDDDEEDLGDSGMLLLGGNE